MIIVIAGTNRPESKTVQVARAYFEILRSEAEEDVEFVDLNEMQEGMYQEDMYEEDGQGKALKEAQDLYFIPAEKWVIVSPEYNGSFPGAIKMLLDALSVREATNTFHNKKVALVGVSSGRTGNWLGMNQLTSILNYLKMNVYYNKLAINRISHEMDAKGNLLREKTILFMENQIRGFLDF